MLEKSNRPAISVCIANYNGLAVIEACIGSILVQHIAPEIEIIVHDDASTDSSATLIRSRYPEIQLIESHDNVGFCIANNRMAAQAQGDYILLLNNDAELLPDALHTLLAAAQAASKPTILSLPQYSAENGEIIDRGCLLDPFFNPTPNLDPARRDVAMVIGACLWIPRKLWDELGGFPEWFGSIGEDLYLCCRARLAGYPVQVLSVSGYRHWVGTSFGGGKVQNGQLTTTFRRRALSERNKTYVMALTCPSPVVQLLLPLHMLLLLLEGVLLVILQKRINYLREIYLPVFQALYRHRVLLLETRKTTMAQKASRRFDFFTAFHITPYKLHMLLRHGLPHLK